MAIPFDLKFIGLPRKPINLDRIKEFIADNSTKRINFAYTHKNALKKGDKGVIGWLNLPFGESFEYIARRELNLDIVLFQPRFGNGLYRRINDEKSFESISNFIEKYRDIVFLKDCLDLSISLSMHESEPGKRTETGQQEYEVKYNSNKKDTTGEFNALLEKLQYYLETLPYFKDVDYICAIPSSKPFICEMINRLEGFSFEIISDHVKWEAKSGSLKELTTPEDKLNAIDKWGLKIDDDLDLKNKNILLIDDMYKSGVTMQYVAMKFKKAGASRVFGLTLVKALGNN